MSRTFQIVKSIFARNSEQSLLNSVQKFEEYLSKFVHFYTYLCIFAQKFAFSVLSAILAFKYLHLKLPFLIILKCLQIFFRAELCNFYGPKTFPGVVGVATEKFGIMV